MERKRASIVVLLKEARGHCDASLVEKCRRGDGSAFDELVRRHKDRLYNVVYRFLGSHEDAQDVVQEVFVRAYRSIEGFRGESQVYTWLYRIALNLARNRVRDSKRKGRDKGTSLEALEGAAPGVAGRASSTERNPGSEAMAHELEETLQRVLDELPESCRMAFVLRTVDGLSYEEIAELMECPRGTVKSRLNQARRMLRDRLEELSVL